MKHLKEMREGREVGSRLGHTMLLQVMFLNNKHNECIEFLMSIHYAQQIPWVSLGKYLCNTQKIRQNHKGIDTIPLKRISTQVAVGHGAVLVQEARTTKA